MTAFIPARNAPSMPWGLSSKRYILPEEYRSALPPEEIYQAPVSLFPLHHRSQGRQTVFHSCVFQIIFYLPERTAAGYCGFDAKHAAASEYFHRSRFDRYILCQMAQNPFFAVFLNFSAVLRVVVFSKMRFIISPLVPVISVIKLSARTIPRSAAMALQ